MAPNDFRGLAEAYKAVEAKLDEALEALATARIAAVKSEVQFEHAKGELATAKAEIAALKEWKARTEGAQAGRAPFVGALVAILISVLSVALTVYLGLKR
jgi:hypothetical protein